MSRTSKASAEALRRVSLSQGHGRTAALMAQGRIAAGAPAVKAAARMAVSLYASALAALDRAIATD